MISIKSIEISSKNKKPRIKSMQKELIKGNTEEISKLNNRKRIFSLVLKDKRSGFKNHIPNQRKGLAGLKPLNWKGQTFKEQPNCLVIQPMKSVAKNHLNFNKQHCFQHLTLENKNKNSFTQTSSGELKQSPRISLNTAQQGCNTEWPQPSSQRFQEQKIFIQSKNDYENQKEYSSEKITQISSEKVEQFQILAQKQLMIISQQSKISLKKYIIQSKTIEIVLRVNLTSQLLNKLEILNNEAMILQEKNNISKCWFNQQDAANRKVFDQYTKMIKSLAQVQEKYQRISAQIEIGQQKLKTVTFQLHKTNNKLEQAKRKGQQIENYVTTQQKRVLLHQVSEDYKQTEADMYDYALQMQTNTWATGLKEVKPFTQQEKYLEQRMNSLHRQLTNDKDDITFEKKCNEIQTFMLKMFASFKRMNDDMRQVNDFKSKCIREFVKRMQKWLQNWQLKQQFLVNLRQQFAVDSTKLQSYFLGFQQVLVSKGLVLQQIEEFNMIKDYIQKLKENYKLGNSFY